MSLGSWLSREWKIVEIDGLKYAATKLNLALPALEGLVDTNAPQTVQGLIAVIESADGKVLGPLVAGIINTALSAYEADIAPELETAVANGGPSLVANMGTALNTTIAKLEADIEPQVTTHGTAASAEAPVEAPAATVEPAPEPPAAPAAETTANTSVAETGEATAPS